jgi:hypothetical protein
MSSTYEQTIAKLERLATRVPALAALGDLDGADQELEALRTYRGCFYCLKYRTVLDGHAPACCATCPVHKFGERWHGRPRLYNGCYAIPAYRDMVRLATLFSEQKDERVLGPLVDAIRGVIAVMRSNEPLLHVQDGGARQ